MWLIQLSAFGKSKYTMCVPKFISKFVSQSSKHSSNCVVHGLEAMLFAANYVVFGQMSFQMSSRTNFSISLATWLVRDTGL